MGAANGSTAMVVQHEGGPTVAKVEASRAFEPRDISEAERLCKILVASGLLPRSIQRPEAAFAIVAAGRELGLTAMQSLRSIHIIEGKPSLSADLIAALCKSRSDICQYFQLVESTATVAKYKTHRRGDPEPTSMSFTWEDAQRAGVTGKDNWKKYPAAMLRARCITALARAVYPDLAMGIYDPDEIGPEAPAAPAKGNFEVVPDTSAAVDAEIEAARVFAIGLLAKVDGSETVAAVNSAAKEIAKQHKAGRISDEHLTMLKRAVANRRERLLMPHPDQPPIDDGPVYDREPEGREPGEEG